MFAARILAYDVQYPVTVKCPSCGETNKKTIDLSELGAKEIDFKEYPKGINEFETELPISKKKIVFKLLTHADEQHLLEEMKKIKKKIAGFGDTEITTRLKYSVVSVDGETDRAKVRKFIDDMLSKDSLFLRGRIADVSPDVDSTFDFECNECGHTDELVIPMELSFFWPSGKL